MLKSGSPVTLRELRTAWRAPRNHSMLTPRRLLNVFIEERQLFDVAMRSEEEE